VLFVIFIVVERRVRDPLIDLSLFRNRAFVLITVGGTMANIVYTVTVLCTTIYLQDGRGLSPTLAGVVFLAPSVAVELSGPLAGRLAGWQPVSVLIPATMLFGGASLLATSAVDAWGTYVPLLGLTGFAWASAGRYRASEARRSSIRRAEELLSQPHGHGDDRRGRRRIGRNTDRPRGAGTADIAAATGVVGWSRCCPGRGAVLLAITLIGRRTRQASGSLTRVVKAHVMKMVTWSTSPSEQSESSS
jgi:hypothetical protein